MPFGAERRSRDLVHFRRICEHVGLVESSPAVGMSHTARKPMKQRARKGREEEEGGPPLSEMPRPVFAESAGCFEAAAAPVKISKLKERAVLALFSLAKQTPRQTDNPARQGGTLKISVFGCVYSHTQVMGSVYY